MTETILQIGDLKITLAASDRGANAIIGADPEWLHCHVAVQARTFTGSFNWAVMPNELVSLANDLCGLHDQFPKRGTVNFEGVEPNLSLSFNVGHRGEVQVKFSAQDQFSDSIILQGSFDTDQDMLLNVANQLRGFVRSVMGGAT